jgi:hypothetical protein
MGQRIDETALDTLFREARTHSTWQPKPVTDQTLRDLLEARETLLLTSASPPAPAGAAQRLGINRTALQFLMKKLVIERPT